MKGMIIMTANFNPLLPWTMRIPEHLRNVGWRVRMIGDSKNPDGTSLFVVTIENKRLPRTVREVRTLGSSREEAVDNAVSIALQKYPVDS